MRSLLIDTSSFFMHVAVLEDKNVLYHFKEEIKMDMASRIVPVIEEAFQNLSFKIEDIDKIFVVNGPGSFTGIRVGVTAAKMIAWALKKDIITLSSLEFLATTSVDKKYHIPAIDARRGYVYAGVYDSELNCILKDQYILYTELSSYFEEGTIISHDNLENSVRPKEDIVKIVEKHADDAPFNPHEGKPNYLKVTEAEEKKLAGAQ